MVLNVGHPLMNNASEMNLYSYDGGDEPFSLIDLDWLYNNPDKDPGTPTSRLAQLAPVSLNNTYTLNGTYSTLPGTITDSQMRKRFLTTEAWDLNSFAMGTNPQIGSYLDYTVNVTAARAVQWDNTGAILAAVPINQVGMSIAHRDRRVNLNFPLPLSNNPEEPVRQKWVRETYELLKRVVPPSSIDTPEKLAKLSQFVVNIIDFRDPDAACTRFVNTDIVVTPPTAVDQYPTLAFRNTANPIQDKSGNSYLPYSTGLRNGRTIDPKTLKPTDVVNHNYLEQFGMENNAVAMNEVLSFSFERKVGTGPTATKKDTPRLFVEFLNTLSSDGHEIIDTTTDPTKPTAIRGAEGSNLNLGDDDVTIPDPNDPTNPPVAILKALHYDLVIAEDNIFGRPDRVTGQLVPDTTATARKRAIWKIKYEDELSVDKQYAPPQGYHALGNTVEETLTTDPMTNEILTIKSDLRRNPQRVHQERAGRRLAVDPDGLLPDDGDRRRRAPGRRQDGVFLAAAPTSGEPGPADRRGPVVGQLQPGRRRGRHPVPVPGVEHRRQQQGDHRDRDEPPGLRHQADAGDLLGRAAPALPGRPGHPGPADPGGRHGRRTSTSPTATPSSTPRATPSPPTRPTNTRPQMTTSISASSAMPPRARPSRSATRSARGTTGTIPTGSMPRSSTATSTASPS